MRLKPLFPSRLLLMIAAVAGGCASHGLRAVDPDSDSRVEIKSRRIDMDLPGEAHDYAPELQRWNAPRVTMKASGDFIAEVKVTGEFDPKGPSTIAGRKAYNGAGLIVIADRQNTVTLQRGAWTDGQTQRDYVNFEVRTAGKLTVSRSSLRLQEREVWLRLERRGQKFYASASEDAGRTWRGYAPETLSLPNPIQTGVEAVSSSTRRFRCTFEDFKLFQRSPS